MQEKTMLQILQKTQHDLMNNLQVIQGYLSMDKIDMVKTKLADYIDYYYEERKLIHINAPHFILWVMQFNHANIELSYRINFENKDLSKVDLQLLQHCKEIVNIIINLGQKRELYNMDLRLNDDSQSNITVTITIDGPFKQKNLIQAFEAIGCTSVRRFENEIICEFSYTTS